VVSYGWIEEGEQGEKKDWKTSRCLRQRTDDETVGKDIGHSGSEEGQTIMGV
jgi:hypothetical protein